MKERAAAHCGYLIMADHNHTELARPGNVWLRPMDDSPDGTPGWSGVRDLRCPEDRYDHRCGPPWTTASPRLRRSN